LAVEEHDRHALGWARRGQNWCFKMHMRRLGGRGGVGRGQQWWANALGEALGPCRLGSGQGAHHQTATWCGGDVEVPPVRTGEHLLGLGTNAVAREAQAWKAWAGQEG